MGSTRGGQRVKVMVTDEEMGVGSEHDEWPRGRRAGRTHSSLLLDVSLSKALNPSFAWLNDCYRSPPSGRLAVMA